MRRFATALVLLLAVTAAAFGRGLKVASMKKKMEMKTNIRSKPSTDSGMYGKTC